MFHSKFTRRDFLGRTGRVGAVIGGGAFVSACPRFLRGTASRAERLYHFVVSQGRVSNTPACRSRRWGTFYGHETKSGLVIYAFVPEDPSIHALSGRILHVGTGSDFGRPWLRETGLDGLGFAYGVSNLYRDHGVSFDGDLGDYEPSCDDPNGERSIYDPFYGRRVTLTEAREVILPGARRRSEILIDEALDQV